MLKALMYHDIRDYKDTNYPSRLQLKSFMTLVEFKNQLQYISKNYNIIRSHEIAEYQHCSNHKNVILTFDDGLQDHYNVAEILSDMNIPGTFFIPTLAIRDGVVIKSHKIQFILAALSETTLVQRILESTPDYVSNTYLWEKYSVSKWKDNWWSPEMVFTTNILRDYDVDNSITDSLFANIVTADEIGFCNEFYLSELNIHNMINAGHDIGAHGYTSDGLTLISNQEYDITESLKYIRKFHQNDLIYSYPNGLYDTNTIELMSKHGCEYAYTTNKSVIDNDTSMLEIPRFDASQDIKI